MDSKTPIHINSYIILDLETTGLPKLGTKTKITELSILCVSRPQILETFEEQHDTFLPRVANKLNLYFDPEMLIEGEAAKITGLSNEKLKHSMPFDNRAFGVINNLICIMPPPICILAHNGNRFDFPILRSEIACIGKALADDIYCADSLLAFREVIPRNREMELAALRDLEYDFLLELEELFLTSDEEDSSESEVELEARHPAKKKLVNGVSRSWLNSGTRHSLKSYSLKDIYTYMTGKKMTKAHQAEGDTSALLECIVLMGPLFLQWVDSNCKLFKKIRKLW